MSKRNAHRRPGRSADRESSSASHRGPVLVDTFAGLLAGLDAPAPSTGFYDRLCLATCRLAQMGRAVLYLRLDDPRRMGAVGAHGMKVSDLLHAEVDLSDAPMLARALESDEVLESSGAFASELPPECAASVGTETVACIPVSAGGRWYGVMLTGREDRRRPLLPDERQMLWCLGKTIALAAAARAAGQDHERARYLAERVDLTREIHDRIVQRLFGVSLAMAGGDGLTAQEQGRCLAELECTLAELRRVIERPLDLASGERRSFTSVLATLRREHPEIRVVGRATSVPSGLQALATAVLAEAVRNAYLHARPTVIDVRIHRKQKSFLLEVVNDGVDVAPNAPGLGLRLAGIDALHHGGLVDFGPSARGRWRVILTVPLPAGG